MKKIIAISITTLLIASCGATQKAGHNFADSINKSSVSSKIGKNYMEEASKYRLSRELPPKKIFYIGQLVNKEALTNGNSIFIHRSVQNTGGSSSSSMFGFITGIESKKDIRYDMSAFLVGSDGIIKDAAHGRYNTIRDCFSYVIGNADGSISSEKCTNEEFNQELTQSNNIILTTTGQPISVWRN